MSTVKHARDNKADGFVCKCGKEYSRKDNLDAHLRSQSGIKPFVCKFDNCDRAYSYASALRNHMKTHFPEKKIKCKVCGLLCTHSQSLKEHMNTHTGNKPYKCRCGRSFAKGSSLIRHERICEESGKYEEEGRHKCDCGKTFNRSDEYDQHLRVHTNERPYQCDECDSDFTQRASLEYHKSALHSECPSCNLPGRSSIFKYKYCYPCGLFKIGRTPQQKRQDIVFQFVEKELEHLEPIFDSIPSGQNCTKKRPDILIQLPFRKIIIEVDEHQHKNYSCEIARMNELASSGDILPTVFIRYNPDSWKDESGNSRKIPTEKRLETLREEIEQWTRVRKQSHFALAVYLYYDGKVRKEEKIPMEPEDLKGGQDEPSEDEEEAFCIPKLVNYEDEMF